jgi:hypothetical protein
MMKLKLLILATSLVLSNAANAALGGTDGSPWKASADTVGAPGHSGIVVTDSTYAACVAQFQAAMDSHAFYHGDVFSNIKYCHYNPGGVVAVGEYAELQLSEALIDLEGDHNIHEYLQKKQSLLKRYKSQAESLPEVPRKSLDR